MAKKHTFSDEKHAIEQELSKRGDLSTKEKEKLIKRIESYQSACKKLKGAEEEKKTCCGHTIAIGSYEFKYALDELKQEVTPFKKFKEKVANRISEIEDGEMEKDSY